MQIKELASLITPSKLTGNEQAKIKGIQIDSRKVNEGDLFICLTGSLKDGHDYARQAIDNGATALVTEKRLEVEVPQLIVKNSRLAMAIIADHFYQHPSKELKVIGVTGTNGKTTTTYLLEKILNDHGCSTGLMGTIEMKIGGQIYPVLNTTQDAADLQKSFRQMKDEGENYCVMEVSSHALEMGRVKGVHFRTALFTNLTQDHLDYHGTMERYREAKGLLFSRLGNTYASSEAERSYAVLNADDPASEYFARMTSAQVITYGINNEADVRAHNIRITSQGTAFTLSTFKGEQDVNLKLIGKFNVYNALGAVAAALLENIPLEEIVSSLERTGSVQGRMEVVDEGQPFLVLVDYAHTPDGLENALSTISEFAEGQIFSVFGCGGDRDRTKRPQMGEIAARYSDYVFVTSDNPRSEEPEAILDDIEPGLLEAGLTADQYEKISDREEAIRRAIDKAGPKDVILIAGKGHETYQIINGTTRHFDDREAARQAIRGRRT
ncbi:UDP-N-acetylmuramoyl-L-alanyl-D-glutamate--2,6-diaminopimelate ligase [Paenibacillus senegalensis]|uniref:UDP-N-acetylmuramoyl-L-alanyl-D-glutamate--2, 6-diaminopimelate ligase n=1 Tax=Paenibacillus senegalensis TaxID=1465766 RepID=UPI0002895CCC|nr:UDP-N-acetylmuramoyl-L-alanyl-D-glutamate--2,6-diaminopimelate ligase [Paenibacillus senegalensis]